MGLISRYKTKPEHVRRRFAAVSSLVITGVIVFVWVSVSTGIFKGSTSVEVKKDERRTQVASPLQSMGRKTVEIGSVVADEIVELGSTTGDFLHEFVQKIR